jgi:hypothetical protein
MIQSVPPLIPANTTSATITVKVKDDNIVETGGETVTMTLLSTNTSVTIGTPDAATVTIADNDFSSVSIAATIQAAEPSTDGWFILTMTNPVSVPTVVILAVNGTATQGIDYTAIGASILIPAYTTIAWIPVLVNDDNIVETGGESVILTLVGTNNAVTVGIPSIDTVNIADNDASNVSIVATEQASEPDINGLFTLTLTNPVSIPTTVTYTVTGTANEGIDYDAIGTTVMIPANSTSVSIYVNVIDDYIIEGEETVILKLVGTNTAVTIGEPSEATVTITDDETSSISTVTTKTGLYIYSFNHEVYVKDLSGNPEYGDFYLYNMMGQEISHELLSDISLNKYTFSLPDGYYVVRVKIKNRTYIKKVYLN